MHNFIRRQALPALCALALVLAGKLFYSGTTGAPNEPYPVPTYPPSAVMECEINKWSSGGKDTILRTLDCNKTTIN